MCFLQKLMFLQVYAVDASDIAVQVLSSYLGIDDFSLLSYPLFLFFCNFREVMTDESSHFLSSSVNGLEIFQNSFFFFFIFIKPVVVF